MRFSPEILSDVETMRLMDARNHQSHSLIEAARDMLRQATEIDLSNIATEILYKYPEAHTIVLLDDQRPDFKGVIFCGHIDDENGEKIGDSFKAKEFVEELLQHYKIADKESIADRVINLREYALKVPKWLTAPTLKG